MDASAVQVRAAWVVLGGHRPRPAELVVARYPAWAWAARTASFLAGWAGATAATFVLTFDPFITALPFFMLGTLAWRTLRGRYRVESFRGECPRCAHPLAVRPGSAIDLPHPLVCYHCHHEPHLAAA
jgi:hypothetical protein